MTSGGFEAVFKDGSLVLTLAHGPSNALAPGVRADVIAALASPPEGCRAVVLLVPGSTIFSLATREPDHGSPTLADLCEAVEGAPVPVVAAVQGLTLGTGAALALAARARISQRNCRIAFPEVVFGLCPTGGSIRRLTRLVGASAALEALVAGRAITAEEALALGVIDAVVEGELLPSALALADQLARGTPRTYQTETAASWQGAVAAARGSKARALPATRRIIDCVEAAFLLPPDASDRFEAVVRSDLEGSDEAAGLCAAAFAERRAARLPAAIARAEALPLNGLGLVGEGAPLVTLARAALRQGISVRWLHPSAAGMADCLGLPDAGGVQHVTNPADLADLALQVHAEARGAAFPRPAVEGAAVLVLNGAKGEIGLSLAPSGRLAEVAVTEDTDAVATATAFLGLRRLQLAPLMVGDTPGIGQAILRAGEAALAHLAVTGVAAVDLTAALAPFALRPPKTATPVTPREMERAEIARRWLGAMIVAGAELLDQVRVRRPSDIDYALITGYGFARWQGGPMHLADRQGLMALRRDLRLWAEEAPIWLPPPLLDRLIRDGLSLAALNGD